MRFEWDAEKDRANRKKHGLSFEQAQQLFTSGIGFLEIYDDQHSDDEDRFIAIGPVAEGVIVAAFTERPDDVVRIVSARLATTAETSRLERFWRGQNE